ncbi:MAG: aminodeoxychorismate synthase component I [Pseudopedobacter saltans]|uniref:Aminodeoxychorismate synthase component I n=1 Tax=Pseudopedobacter saltans TaxID=151895 RepID=A0A2W5G0U0_9SPHI|nr:MAG: aminodeoxychorismate synthase component I [Pseudopedobacter saltans]
MQAKEIFQQMDEWFAKGKPFFFLLDYNMENGECIALEKLGESNILYQCPISSNIVAIEITSKRLEFQKFPESISNYQKKFDKVKSEIAIGNSYLVNLTCQSPINTNYTLSELFNNGQAKYKLFFKDKFIHFSPETFVTIKDKKIATFPMKGTIDASQLDADKTILDDPKEKTEQYIITDLMRNDLSIVAENVTVEKFRYLDRVETNDKPLYQVSSHIEGDIKKNFQDKPGTIFSKLLPAGSICGAPKKKTVDIIQQVENHERGYYTGVWGIFNGQQLDSCVIIRMIEKENNQLYFKSGGGITAASILEKEYQEMIDKIYVPVY